MSEELVSRVSAEVERITAMPLGEQVNDFSALRDKLESVLNDSDKSFFDGADDSGTVATLSGEVSSSAPSADSAR